MCVCVCPGMRSRALCVYQLLIRLIAIFLPVEVGGPQPFLWVGEQCLDPGGGEGKMGGRGKQSKMMAV